jgi:hypothetical protein
MADGTVSKIGFDSRPLPRPDPRSGKTVKGWGNYVVITHTDGSKSLYAHLQTAISKCRTAKLSLPGRRLRCLITLEDHRHLIYMSNMRPTVKSSKMDRRPI